MSVHAQADTEKADLARERTELKRGLYQSIPSLEIDGVSVLDEFYRLDEGPSSAWDLWRRIAAKDPAFGDPDLCGAHVPLTWWESATV